LPFSLARRRARPPSPPARRPGGAYGVDHFRLVEVAGQLGLHLLDRACAIQEAQHLHRAVARGAHDARAYCDPRQLAGVVGHHQRAGPYPQAVGSIG
jgi:hypothetical protein